MVGFSVSETDLFVESQLCNIVFSKDFFGVVSPLSTELHVPVVSVTGALKLRLN